MVRSDPMDWGLGAANATPGRRNNRADMAAMVRGRAMRGQDKTRRHGACTVEQEHNPIYAARLGTGQGAARFVGYIEALATTVE